MSVPAYSRARCSWNERFSHWQRPASDSEELIIQRAADRVAAAIAKNAWLTAEGVEVGAQGSYHNNTNVRVESDMDMRVCHPGLLVLPAPNVPWDRAISELQYTSQGGQIPEIAGRLRLEVAMSLVGAFGAANVDCSGSKAFTVSGIPGSRAKTDVVPTVKCHYIVERRGLTHLHEGHLEAIPGVVIYPSSGRQILNFPDQHRENGIEKRKRTGLRFKRVVRILKNLRDELVELGLLPKGAAPSFLLECLAYRVEDPHYCFDEDDFTRVRRIIIRMAQKLADPLFYSSACEINDVKLLFDEHQPWTAAGARGFVTAAWRHLEA